ncbi:Sulfate transporter, putative [Perkinsus marinus ATCC 50983]|uniref:Sulfate transporter, putative n=1 Tax=Perkinsus marinus (strain ATCC 50983 / TXsc) TaxID=423536 RepID=C5K7P8_PERM5|nr:Sulfate transporter, putative [Perkinsus marinus ATCC 50983]EER19583.1 Sulfate transporter, putative [Perkinsus marinus ATCC 50983]|eukprot:XP_002787787.1 Sulfate transporter, putative [Perkinsus marinus ATCC 50983]
MEPSRQAAVEGPPRVSAGDLDHADVARSESSKQSPVYDTGLSQEAPSGGDSSSDESDMMKRTRQWSKTAWRWLRLHKLDFLSGLTVALAQVPEAVAFSFVANVDPVVGLQAAWMMGVITSLAGGRPGQISGATGSTAVVMPPIVAKAVYWPGIGYLFYTVMLAGIIQIVFGVFRAGKLLRMISAPVMIGFVDGLAIVIFLAQLEAFKWTQGNAVGPPVDGEPWLPWDDILKMLLLIAITMTVTFVLPKLTRFPSALTGGEIIVGFCWSMNLMIANIYSYSNDAALGIALPSFDGELLSFIIPHAVVIALIGLIESLLTLNLIDEITHTRGNPNRECWGQGLAQLITGMFGGMGGCAMIGQSMINIKSGGTSRLSGFVAGIFTLFILLFVYHAINIIPIAALVGVMFCVVIHTFEWSTFGMLAAALMTKQMRSNKLVQRYILRGSRKLPRGDVLIIVVVTVVTLLTDLAIAVGVGVCLQALIFSWQSHKSLSVVERPDMSGDDLKVYDLHGPLCFASASDFLEAFDVANDPNTVELHCQNADIHGYSAMEAINTLAERYSHAGKRIIVKSVKKTDHAVLAKAEDLIHEMVVIDKYYEPITYHKRMLSVERWGEEIAFGGISHHSPTRRRRGSRHNVAEERLEGGEGCQHGMELDEFSHEGLHHRKGSAFSGVGDNTTTLH